MKNIQPALLVLQMVEGTVSQGMQVALEMDKAKKQSLQKGTQS
jgi:hypothetical protein